MNTEGQKPSEKETKKTARAERLAQLHAKLNDPNRQPLPPTISSPDPNFATPKPKGHTALDQYINASITTGGEPTEDVRRAAIKQVKGKEHGIQKWAKKKSKGAEVPSDGYTENGQ